MTYWQNRQQQLNKQMEKDEAKLKKRLSSFYDAEFARLEKEIAAYYQKYGKDNVIEYRHLMESLPDADKKLLIEQIDEFAKKYPQYADLIPVRESIYKLNRLEGLQYSIRMQQLEIGAVNNEQITAYLNKQAERGVNAAAEAMGFGKNFYANNPDITKLFVNVGWNNGKDFSQRIWENVDKLSNYLRTDIAQAFARGDSYDRIVRQLRERFSKITRNDAYRLIYTEGTYVMAESTIQPFTEDFEKYKISTVGDGKVCPICKAISKETFNISERQAGVNFPPFHPWCRCTFEIVVDDWDTWMDQYVADKVLTDDEEYSLKQYVSGKAYIINDKLRNNTPLNDEDEEYIHHLDNALRKMPKYQGNLNRSLLFDYDEDKEQFIKTHQKGNVITYDEYLSATKDAIPYDASGQVQIYVIQSSRGRDISTYNKNELEVLYPRKSSFEILDVITNDKGITNIFMREVISDAGKEAIF